MFAKCANPACPERFQFHIGGTFFRFSRGNANPSPKDDPTAEIGNVHNVEHYWLCPRCARIYTLVYVDDTGVILRPLWTQEPIIEILKKVVAA